MSDEKKPDPFLTSLSEAESMFFRAVEAADVEAVDGIATDITDFFADKFSENKNADVMLALCGFLASYCEFVATESNTESRVAMMLLQVGMQRAAMATEEEQLMVVPPDVHEPDPRLH